MNKDYKIPEKDLIVCTLATAYAFENVSGPVRRRIAVSSFMAGAKIGEDFAKWLDAQDCSGELDHKWNNSPQLYNKWQFFWREYLTQLK